MRRSLALAAVLLAAGCAGTPPREAASAESYTACGCGCCPGTEPAKRCLYRSKGESLEDVRKKDRAAARSPDCPMAGCSVPIVYSYCD